MASLFIPQPVNPALPIFFNVDGVVGSAPAQNLREDVLLVQFLLKTIGAGALDFRNPDPAFLAAAKAVTPTGNADAPTIGAIRACQVHMKTLGPGTVVDGRVSPAKGYSYGGSTWTIVVLNELVRRGNVGVWPRIDKVPGFPLELNPLITRAVSGS